ncbi:MAG: flippase-like domain-containing protein [Planctomycetes bacterium]|nr:flippase-like domain-containing protein [Planctomycetota bacterium]
MKLFHRLMIVVGIALFAGLLWECGPEELLKAMRGLGWMLVPFVLLEGVADVFHSLGTRLSFRRAHRTIPLLRMFRIRLAGVAINYVSPTAGMGGEIVKGTLFGRFCPGTEVASALVIDKLSIAIAQLSMATIGGSLILLWLPFPPVLTGVLYLTSVLLGSGMLGFLYFQKRGQLGRVAGWVGGLVGRERFASWVGDSLVKVDAALATYYRESGADLGWSILAHALGYACGIVQGWLFLWTLFGRNSIADASTIWILGTWCDMAGFMIPAGLGIQEGSRMIIFKALHLTSAVGFAFSLALRIEQVFWTAVGFGLYAIEYRELARAQAGFGTAESECAAAPVAAPTAAASVPEACELRP